LSENVAPGGAKPVEDRVHKFWVFLLAAIAFASGIATLAYSGVTGSFASFRIACQLLNTAEAARALDRTQRADVVDRVISAIATSASGPDPQGIALVRQLKTGCPSLPSW
jgi:hypothetical protein